MITLNRPALLAELVERLDAAARPTRHGPTNPDAVAAALRAVPRPLRSAHPRAGGGQRRRQRQRRRRVLPARVRGRSAAAGHQRATLLPDAGPMIAAIAFYQLLATASFTLLGLWFVVVGLSHGGWRTDPTRHRYDLHVALHFLLPGATGLAAVLAGGEPLFWRAAALLAGHRRGGRVDRLPRRARLPPGAAGTLPARAGPAALRRCRRGRRDVAPARQAGADAGRGRGHRAGLPRRERPTCGSPTPSAPHPCPPRPCSEPHLRSDHDRPHDRRDREPFPPGDPPRHRAVHRDLRRPQPAALRRGAGHRQPLRRHRRAGRGHHGGAQRRGRRGAARAREACSCSSTCGSGRPSAPAT